MRILIAALTLSLATLTHADGIYKWEDENGVIHYGSQPPKKQQVEVVKKPKSKRYKQWQEEQNALIAKQQLATDASAEDKPQPADTAQPEQEQQQEQPDNTKAELAARAQRCRSAQQRLQELESHARVREVSADGSYRVLPEEERQQRIQQARRVLKTNC
ncbi:DUF4124 domain-containing protein [Microbulbifer sp.]|uniref:DUF4124 domain-containing protein n=1 Tax=Microbulbifer sp. TaxID=1908541 RepID=UPI00258B7E85|nr:DUF4124 domain-containing protein [Microbulbifer sp.]